MSWSSDIVSYDNRNYFFHAKRSAKRFFCRCLRLIRVIVTVVLKRQFLHIELRVASILAVVVFNIKCKKLISLQHRVRAIKSHIQNSTSHFFWDNVIARSHIALTIHLTWPYLTFALPHYQASKETSKEKNANAITVIMSTKLLLFSVVRACNPVARITYTVLVETSNHAQSKRACY